MNFKAKYLIFVLLLSFNLSKADEASSSQSSVNTTTVKAAEVNTEERVSNYSVMDDFSPSSNGIGVTFFSIAGFETSQIQSNAPSVGSYNYIGFNKRLSPDTKLALQIPFLFNTDGFNKYGSYEKHKASLHDVVLVFADYDFAYIGDLEISMSYKLYLPTSELSQQAKTWFRFRPETYVKLPIGRYSDISWVIKPDIFFQSQRAFYDKTTPTREDGSFVTDPRKTNKIASLEHYLEATLDANKYLSGKISAGFDEDWFYSSDAEGLSGGHNTSAKLSIGAEIRPVKGLRFILSIENKPSLLPGKNGEKVALFRPRDNSINLLTNALLF